MTTPPQQPVYYQPVYLVPAPPPKPPANPMANWALGVGCAAVVTLMCGPVAFPIALTAIGLGIPGLIKAKAIGIGRVNALAGIIIGSSVIALAFIGAIAMALFF